MAGLGRVDQFIPVLSSRDAVSNHTLQVQRLLRDLGVESEIYTEQTEPRLSALAAPFQQHARTPVLYQFAVGSVMVDHLLAQQVPLAINHHNVTPPRFFTDWDPPLVRACAWGEEQLLALAGRSQLAIAVSEFNAHDLRAAGFVAPEVAPILLDTSSFDRASDPLRIEQLRADAGPAWLFVGRIVPNKAQHRLIRALAIHRQVFDPQARLWLVGAVSSAPYERALRGLVRGLGLESAVEFVGSVDDGELAARYLAADVFVVASEHEGCCVPVLEAMHHRVPVVGVDAGAVGETIGNAGIVLPEGSAAVIATAVHRVLADAALADEMRARGAIRVADFDLSITRARFAEVIVPWLESIDHR